MKTTNKGLLMKFLAVPDGFVDIIQTSDGHFLAKGHAEVGYNHFLGKPALTPEGPGKDWRRNVWRGLTFGERKTLVHTMRGCGLNIHTALRNLARC